MSLQTNTSPALSMFLIHIQLFVQVLHWEHLLPWGPWSSKPRLGQGLPQLSGPFWLYTEPCEMMQQPASRSFLPVQWCTRWERLQSCLLFSQLTPFQL